MKQKIIWLQLFAEAAATGESGTDAGCVAQSEGQSAGLDREEHSGAKMTWEQVKADPEFSQKMQEMVKSRLKNAKSAQENWEKLSPALKTLSASYDLDPNDFGALNQAILGDKRFARQDPIALHFESLQAQAAQFAAAVPDFNLEKELENPAFVRLTAPNVGISLEDAYYTVHRQEQDAKTARQIANAVRSGAMRPEENGANAPAVAVFDYRSASREQRNALKKQIRLAAAKGEKIYPD